MNFRSLVAGLDNHVFFSADDLFNHVEIFPAERNVVWCHGATDNRFTEAITGTDHHFISVAGDCVDGEGNAGGFCRNHKLHHYRYGDIR